MSYSSLFARIQAALDAGSTQSAEAWLHQAHADPHTYAEALLWRAIFAIQRRQFPDAWLFGCAALAQGLSLAALPLLLAQAAREQGDLATADAIVLRALEHYPLDPDLRAAVWPAQARRLAGPELAVTIRRELPEIADPGELRALLAVLPPGPLGAARLDLAQGQLVGWVLDPQHPATPPRLLAVQGDTRFPVAADAPHPLLRATGFGDQGGFRLRLSASPHPLHLILPDGRALAGSPWVRTAPAPHLNPYPRSAGADATVDVIVPVYRGRARTLECLESLLAAQPQNRQPHAILVLNDASPEPDLVQDLARLAARGAIDLLHHPANLGFVRGMNRAMALHPRRHVVWLNADTRVRGNWLDRLHAIAHGAPDVASVTPLSNQGELMTFPELGLGYPTPDPAAHAALDRLAAGTWNGESPELAVGCGFCLYLRRDALTQVGPLDEIALGAGYGEDTDWCVRAQALGWRHLGAPGVFVAHAGSVSFGSTKRRLAARNNALLRRRYPHAEGHYERHRARDPMRAHRQRLQRARLAAVHLSKPLHLIGACHWQDPRLPLHDQRTTARELPPLGTRWLGWRPIVGGWRVELTVIEDALPIRVEYSLPAAQADLTADLARLPIAALIDHRVGPLPPLLARCLTALTHVMPALPLRPAPPIDARRFLKQTSAILIADVLDTPALGARWLAFARYLARTPGQPHLIAIEDGPWLRQLGATSSLCQPLAPPGTSLARTLALSGCRLAISLDPAPPPAWNAPALAAHLGLPLFAPDSPRARQAGAYPLPDETARACLPRPHHPTATQANAWS